MAVPTAAPLETSGTGGQSRKGPFISEWWVVTGDTSSAGDAVAITPRFSKRAVAVQGAVSYTVSGQVATVALLTDLAAGVKILVEVIGRP